MRTIPIHESLLRPQLLAGGERELVILNAVCAAGLIFAVGGVVGIVTGVLLGGTVQTMLMLVAKKDAQSLATYRSHIHHQKFYPAATAPNAVRQLNH